ncbi:acyl--CoA ligase [Diaphorobacter sp. HDW4A]|uniref:class I adenylate-forming enzyme family protein n=1 Tax=Diaphorobacter sp. HDW4A TaxID=2714924 RepID=UPI00140B2A93|nr:class I adenylate-forming enzyme family protein [Diaphorobacter sp. HDW4A]QIL79942.1 acyl--CoA ligase [Diaphorobacter sp. HDW4A]
MSSTTPNNPAQAAAPSVAAQVGALRTQLTSPGAPFELAPVTLKDGSTASAYRNAFRTLPDVLNAGRAHGPMEFLIFGDDRWTFDRFFAAADAAASRLQKQYGLRAGDRVAIAMRNRPEWAVALVAAALLGAVPVPLNSFGLNSELMSNLEDTTPTWLICDSDRFERVGGSLGELKMVPKVVVVDGEGGDVRWSDLIAPGHDGYDAPELLPDDRALILFTSGATSRAKGVESNQRAVCQAIFNIDYISAVAAMSSPEAVGRIMARKLQPTTLSAVPLFHVSGLHAQLLISLRHGRRLVFVHRWDPQSAIETIRKENVTQFNGAPSMVQQLIAQPGFELPENSGNLSGLGFGGAGLHQRLITDVLEKFPGRMSGIGFGLTESNGVCAACSGRLFEEHPAASGALSPIIDIRIAGVNGEALPAGESGEVWLRGVSLMQGYWGQPKATEAVMQDGWFRTGDIGVIDANGVLTIVDRIKDVINRSGEKIAAVEVESCLMQHDALEEAAVFSMPHEVTGEQVVAVVVGKPGAEVSEGALREFVSQRLAAYKVPNLIVVRGQPLPRNPAGKMLKSNLRKLVDELNGTAV